MRSGVGLAQLIAQIKSSHSQLVGDASGAVVLGAEALRRLQQQLGDAAGHVGEDEVGQVVVGAAQPAGQDPQQVLGGRSTTARRLFRPAGAVFRVADPHRLVIEADPAAAGEFGECRVDRDAPTNCAISSCVQCAIQNVGGQPRPTREPATCAVRHSAFMPGRRQMYGRTPICGSR